jgi:hypothetical protein
MRRSGRRLTGDRLTICISARSPTDVPSVRYREKGLLRASYGS